MRTAGVGTLSRAAFTLVELLVVLVMLSLIVSAALTLYVGGLRVWHQIDQYDTPALSATLAIDSLEKDLMNQYPWDGVKWTGGSDEMNFLVLIRGRLVDSTNRFAEVGYVFEEREQALLRTAVVFDQSGERDPVTEYLGENVTGILFEYAARPEAGQKELRWLPEWKDRASAPVAVRVQMTLGEGNIIVREIIRRDVL